VTDVNETGGQDCIAGGQDNTVYCIEGKSIGTGQVLWNSTTVGTVKKVASIRDLSGNGAEDVIGGSDDSWVYVYEGGKGSSSGVNPFHPEQQPTTIQLHHNYPNPFNSCTTIPFTLSETSNLRIYLTSVKGVPIRTLFEGRLKAGSHEFLWDGRADDHSSLPSGIYILQLVTAENSVSRRIILLK
jgi:hypothetical protein